MTWATHQTGPIPCPICGRINDLHDAPGKEPPGDGDLAICWGCLGVQVFIIKDGKLTARAMVLTEFLDLEPEERAKIYMYRDGIRVRKA